MQVVMCEAYGPPETLVVKTVPSPKPGPGFGDGTDLTTRDSGGP